MRKAKVIRVQHYYDTSWSEDGSPSTKLFWTTPNGRSRNKLFYGGGFWTQEQALIWLDAKYTPRLTNLFGALFYV